MARSKTLSIYLAGKITKCGWREVVVSGLSDAITVGDLSSDGMPEWPVLKNAVLRSHHYVGPFFVACDHGCFHGPATHGVGVDDSDDNLCSGQATSQRQAFSRCLDAIGIADVVFAWIDSKDCYGTISELGYAHALGKRIAIGTPIGFDHSDLWFPLSTADVHIEDESVSGALSRALDRFGTTVKQ